MVCLEVVSVACRACPLLFAFAAVWLGIAVGDVELRTDRMDRILEESPKIKTEPNQKTSLKPIDIVTEDHDQQERA